MTLDIQIRGAHQVADWLETLLWGQPRNSVAVDWASKITDEQLGIAPAAINVGFVEMQRRQRTLGKHYPFQLDGIAARVDRSTGAYPYISLLHLTPHSPCRQLLYPTSSTDMETAFESLVSSAAAGLFGPGGRGLRFGWPSEIGRPREFPAAIDWLAKTVGLALGTGYRPPARKDGGVDVVAWRGFPDGKSGIPLLLVQCTLQADIVSKASDVEVRVWSSWLKMDVDPMTALAIPQTVARPLDWDQITVRTLLLERIRLTELCDGKAPDQCIEWTVAAVEDLSAFLRVCWE